MRRAFTRPMLLLAVAAVGFSGASATAHAQTSAECGQAYEQAQRSRLRKHLRVSRQQLELCSSLGCSASLRGDCTTWLAEVEQILPSVVFIIRGPHGEEVTGVKVTMDGDPLAVAAGAVDVDPGQHVFRFEAAARPPVEEVVTLGEGEKAREVRVTLPEPPPPAAPIRGEAPRPTLLPYVLGGSGIALAVAGSAFEVWGLSKRADVNACQPPSCSMVTYASDKDAAQRTFLAGDVLIGAGIAALAAGTILFIVRRPLLRQSPVEVVGAWPVTGGYMGIAQARF